MAFSFENPTTREQKEYVAQCDYFFRVLIPLVNPKSRTHWIKSFMALDHAAFPPHILHATTLHGHYVLKGGPRQQLLTDLVLRQLQSPCDHNIWTEIFEVQDIKHIVATYEPEAGWRPQSYSLLRQQLLHAPAYKHHKNQRFRRELSPRLQEQEKKVFAKLAQLEVRIQEKNKELETKQTPEMVCAQIGEETGVALRPFDTEGKKKEECGICRGVLSRVEDLDVVIMDVAGELACKKDVLTGKKFSRFLKVQGGREAKKEILELLEVVKRDVQGMKVPDSDVDRLVSDLLEFRMSVQAARAMMDELEGKKCFDPVELTCGHVLGLHCISLWLKEALTCPYCRCELAAPKPEQQSYQTYVEEELDDKMDEDILEAMNTLARFDAEGYLIDEHGDGDCESDVEPCDVDDED